MAEVSKPKRRRVRPAPTVRERAEKAQAEASKPKRQKSSRVGKALKVAFKPLAFLGVLGKFRIVQVLGKVFRFIGKILWPAYFRNSWRELRLVSWPSWKQSRRLTYAVIIFAVLFGGIIYGLDFGLDKAFRHLLIGK
ncbi:MAG TPA: preprotein translocase subunit SecE [Candidatus Saccharimonadales bacterium]|nr:preprotein translocase subunit SecE [Candidatus Saccharimonadales bacterium]